MFQQRVHIFSSANLNEDCLNLKIKAECEQNKIENASKKKFILDLCLVP